MPKLRASVLCPGMIATNIITAGRNRPPDLQNEVDEATRQAMAEQSQQMANLFMTQGMPPAEVAEMVLDAIREERLYILTHETIKDALRRRVEPILEDRNPELPQGGGLAMRARGNP